MALMASQMADVRFKVEAAGVGVEVGLGVEAGVRVGVGVAVGDGVEDGFGVTVGLGVAVVFGLGEEDGETLGDGEGVVVTTGTTTDEFEAEVFTGALGAVAGGSVGLALGDGDVDGVGFGVGVGPAVIVMGTLADQSLFEDLTFILYVPTAISDGTMKLMLVPLLEGISEA